MDRTPFNYANDAGNPRALSFEEPLWFKTHEWPAAYEGDGGDHYSSVTGVSDGWGCSQFDYEDQGDATSVE